MAGNKKVLKRCFVFWVGRLPGGGYREYLQVTNYMILFTFIYRKTGVPGVWAELESQAGATERRGVVRVLPL